MKSSILLLLVQQLLPLVYLWYLPTNAAFSTTNNFTPNRRTTTTSFLGQQFKLTQRKYVKTSSSNRSTNINGSTKLGMFLGDDGGIFGVGAPEVAVILLVGYFLLGPTELFKLTKEVGKLFNSAKTLATQATSTFESSMEDQLNIQEIRKAQQDLTDAFSFRRSINYDEEKEPVDEPVQEQSKEENQETNSINPNKKKKIRRRRKVIKKKIDPDDVTGIVEDLTMPGTTILDSENIPAIENSLKSFSAEIESTENLDTSPVGWFEEPESEPQFDLEKEQEENRFQNQLSSQWNDTILQNTDKLSPLSSVMERLAILEDERAATEKRLEDEFRVRTEMEEKFYSEKRKLLEEAALEIQSNVFLDPSNQSTASDTSDNTSSINTVATSSTTTANNLSINSKKE